MKKLPKPEWSFPVEVATINSSTAHYHITADLPSMKVLVNRFDVLNIKDLNADVNIKREASGALFHITGQVRGQVIQECSVTGLDVMTEINEPLQAYFVEQTVAVFAKAKAEKAARGVDPEIPMIDEKDAPETVVDGVIDIGEVAAQFFSLAIPAYPRQPDLPPLEITIGETTNHHDDPSPKDSDDPPPNPDSPFLALRAWREEMKKK